jgi:glycosyltransferase involved in cell wall biosynthesis
MEKQNKYLIIIPALNEEKTIGELLDSVSKLRLPCDILVVNDGSTDNTAKIAKRPGVHLLTHALNLGYGAALHTGLLYAEKHNYRAIITMDGDGQHIPSEIIHLVRCYETTGTDVILGSRYLDESSYRMKFIRNIGRLFFSYVTFLVTSRKIKDVTSGFQLLSREAARFLSESDFPSDYPDANILILLELSGYGIKEIPVRMQPAHTKDSIHYGLRPLFYIYKMMLSIFIILLNKKVFMPKLNKGRRGQ